MDRFAEAKADGGFEQIQLLRRLERDRERYMDPDYWRAINPDLTISASPFARPPIATVDPADAERHASQLRDEGYLVTTPLAPAPPCEKMARGIARLAAAGLHTAFASVYDEYYQAFEGLEGLFAPILGDSYKWVGNGNYAYFVPPGDLGVSGLTASGPHRDTLGPDRAVIDRQLPTVLTIWVPLTDVSPAESCIYVVPADHDLEYFTATRTIDWSRIGVQSIRALPAAARSVLAWSTHLIHWGSAASSRARHPRMSVTMYFQRADVPPYDDDAIFSCGDEVPFQTRLRWVAQSIGRRGFFD